jgi:hypothetical protein
MDPQPADRLPDDVPVEAMEHAARRLNDGAVPTDVVSELVQMGLSEEAASGVVRQMREVHGLVDREPNAPINTILKLVGYSIVALGMVLWIGNILGFLRTFPLAGFMTILIGTVVLSIRVRKRSSE